VHRLRRPQFLRTCRPWDRWTDQIIFRFFLRGEQYRKVPEKPSRCVHASPTAFLNLNKPQGSIRVVLHPTQPLTTLALKQFVVDQGKVDVGEICRIAVRTPVLVRMGHRASSIVSNYHEPYRLHDHELTGLSHQREARWSISLSLT
jgi:hypothetical protein